MIIIQFEYYVLNYDTNKKKVENFNIFRNCLVQEYTEKAVRKYLRSPKNYKHVIQHKNDFLGREEIAVYGFDALVREIDGIKQKYKYWDDGGEFVGENVFNITRGDEPYFVGYVGQH